MKMNFGEKLKKLRNERKMTQKELAERIGVSRATIAGYETKGKEPPYSTLIKLAEVLNCSIDYLLENSVNIKNENNINTDNQNLNHYYTVISRRKDLQQLLKETEKLSPDSVHRIIKIIEIINEEVKERDKNDSF
ncbi:helix-turn-helix domain-containing protein [Thermoanaerobacterium sp. DL9XJH110]|uniref:helix-turn-helix domain-containing protein n=1 Tax=Thermoanaerobacterium sp. DL9XJH110 TaxID=3386643 RepID=UPI003BB49B09